MSTGADLGQYILQTHSSKKFFGFNGGFEPPDLLWVRQWNSQIAKASWCQRKRWNHLLYL